VDVSGVHIQLRFGGNESSRRVIGHSLQMPVYRVLF